MKASITTEGKLYFFFSEEELKLLGATSPEDSLVVKRREDKFYLKSAKKTDTTYLGPLMMPIQKKALSPNYSVGYNLGDLGMADCIPRRAREVGKLDRDPTTGEWSISLPDEFFSSVPSDDHTPKVGERKRALLPSNVSNESKLRAAIAIINEAVARGDASVRVDRKTGKVKVKAYIEIGG